MFTCFFCLMRLFSIRICALHQHNKIPWTSPARLWKKSGLFNFLNQRRPNQWNHLETTHTAPCSWRSAGTWTVATMHCLRHCISWPQTAGFGIRWKIVFNTIIFCLTRWSQRITAQFLSEKQRLERSGRCFLICIAITENERWISE